MAACERVRCRSGEFGADPVAKGGVIDQERAAAIRGSIARSIGLRAAARDDDAAAVEVGERAREPVG